MIALNQKGQIQFQRPNQHNVQHSFNINTDSGANLSQDSGNQVESVYQIRQNIHH